MIYMYISHMRLKFHDIQGISIISKVKHMKLHLLTLSTKKLLCRFLFQRFSEFSFMEYILSGWRKNSLQATESIRLE